MIDLKEIDNDFMCFSTLVDSPCIWYRRQWHANLKLILKLSIKELMRGSLPHKRTSTTRIQKESYLLCLII
jgi:hypothetical protein